MHLQRYFCIPWPEFSNRFFFKHWISPQCAAVQELDVLRGKSYEHWALLGWISLPALYVLKPWSNPCNTHFSLVQQSVPYGISFSRSWTQPCFGMIATPLEYWIIFWAPPKSCTSLAYSLLAIWCFHNEVLLRHSSSTSVTNVGLIL